MRPAPVIAAWLAAALQRLGGRAEPARLAATGGDLRPEPAAPRRPPAPPGKKRSHTRRAGARISLLIWYRDSKGDRAERLVDIFSYAPTVDAEGRATAEKISTFCHLRRQARTFYVDRIESASDPETGEVIADIPAFILANCPPDTPGGSRA